MIMSKGSDLGSPNAHLLKSSSIVVEDFCTPQTDEVKSNRMFMNKTVILPFIYYYLQTLSPIFSNQTSLTSMVQGK